MTTGDRGPFDSFDEVCTQAQGPPVTRTHYDDLPHRDLHAFCKQRGNAKKDSKASLCARLRKMDEVESARGLSMRRSRTQQDVMDSCEPVGSGQRLDKRRRRADARLNFVTNKESLNHHAQWRDKGMQLFRSTHRIYRVGRLMSYLLRRRRMSVIAFWGKNRPRRRKVYMSRMCLRPGSDSWKRGRRSRFIAPWSKGNATRR